MSVLKINSWLRNVGGWSKNTCTAGSIFSGIISSPVGRGAGGPLGRIIRSLHDTEIKYLVCQTNTKCIQIVDLIIVDDSSFYYNISLCIDVYGSDRVEDSFVERPYEGVYSAKTYIGNNVGNPIAKS